MKKMLRGLLTGVRLFFEPLLFPPYCLIGDHFLENGEILVCHQCLSGLPSTSENHRPFGWEDTDTALDGVFSYWEFSDEFRSLIHQLKYHHKPVLGIIMGKYVAAQLPTGWMGEECRLVPIPLHKTKLRERGYNQAEYIARGIAKRTNIPVQSDLLYRKKYTRTQTTLSRSQRTDNMSDAFVLHRKKIAGRNNTAYLLVDDIFTTGSTLESAASALRSHGGAPVFGVTLGTVPLSI